MLKHGISIKNYEMLLKLDSKEYKGKLGNN